MRKPTFCICENKGAGQLNSNDQGLYFRYIDNIIPLLHKASSHLISYRTVQAG